MEANGQDTSYDSMETQHEMEGGSMYSHGRNSNKVNQNTITDDTFESTQNNNNNDANDYSETEAAELQVRKDRKKTTADAGSRLEGVLNDIKGSTKHLLTEIDAFAEIAEGVTVDYLRCQHSQRKEATRLDEVEPDVAGATARLFQQVQDQIATSGGASINNNMSEFNGDMA